MPFRALRPWESRSPAAWRASSSTFASSPRSPRLTAAPACAAASASPSCWIFIPSSLLLGRGHDFAPPARPAPFERGFFRAVRLVGACRANCRTRQISFVAGRIGVTLPLDVSTSSLLLGGGRDLALPARSAPFGRGFRRGGCLVGACRPVAALGARFRRRWGRRRRAAAGTFPVQLIAAPRSRSRAPAAFRARRAMILLGLTSSTRSPRRFVRCLLSKQPLSSTSTCGVTQIETERDGE